MHQEEELDRYKHSYTSDFPYYEENRMVHAAYGDRIASYISANEIHSTLSLGIGHAEVAHRIINQLANGPLERYVIVDGAPQIIKSFCSSLEVIPQGLELIEGWFETFKYPIRFEVIEAGFILEHVDDPRLVLTRLHQFLEPNGRIFIAVPNARSLHRLLGREANLLDDVYALSSSDLALGHKRYFDLNTLSTLVYDSGFKVVKAEGMLLKPFTTGQLESLKLTPAVWVALLKLSADYPDISNAIYLEAIE